MGVVVSDSVWPLHLFIYLPRWNQLSRLMYVEEQVMARWKLKVALYESMIQKVRNVNVTKC